MVVTDLAVGSRVLGVDVGGTSVKAEIADGAGNVVAAGRSPTPQGSAALDAVAELGGRLIAEAGGVARAVVLPGIVDRPGRNAVSGANIGWSSLEFGGPLERAWGVPVLLDHDLTCAGWAEWATGAGHGYTSVAFVSVGTGIFAALVTHGKVLRDEGLAQPGELGHVVIRPGGRKCPCGALGCLEMYASAAAIAREYSAATGARVDGALAVLAAAGRDERARRVWDDAVDTLADGLTALATLIAPERIVLGDGLSQAGPALLDTLERMLAERARRQPVPSLGTASYGERAGLAGAALLALRGEIT